VRMNDFLTLVVDNDRESDSATVHDQMQRTAWSLNCSEYNGTNPFALVYHGTATEIKQTLFLLK